MIVFGECWESINEVLTKLIFKNIFYSHSCSIWKFLGQGLNPCLCSELSHCSWTLNPPGHGGNSNHLYFCHLPFARWTSPLTPSLSKLPETRAQGSILEGRHGCCRLGPEWVCSLGRENGVPLPPSGRASSGHTGPSGSAAPRHMTGCTHSIRLASSCQRRIEWRPMKQRLWTALPKYVLWEMSHLMKALAHLYNQ